MRRFKSRGEIIEELYAVKEKIEKDIFLSDDFYIQNVFKLTDEDIPKSSFYDADVADLIYDIHSLIFAKYSSLVSELEKYYPVGFGLDETFH